MAAFGIIGNSTDEAEQAVHRSQGSFKIQEKESRTYQTAYGGLRRLFKIEEGGEDALL
jgi:hypothetical protein